MSTSTRYISGAAVMLIIGAGTQAHAAGNDIDLSGIGQGTFNSLVDEAGMIVAYNPVSPAETLGITGFELGLSVTSYKIDDAVWNQAVSDGNAPARIPMPRLMARKGLPYGFDLGASYSKAPGTNISILGGEVRKALIEGSTVSPAVSVMGHYSALGGVDDLDLSAYGVDLGISKGFAIFTPYAGVGQVWYDGREKRADLNLQDRNTSQTRGYLGMRVGVLPFMSVTAQADFSEVNSYSLRLDLGF